MPVAPEQETAAPLRMVGIQLSAENVPLVHPLYPVLLAILFRRVTSDAELKSRTFPRYLSLIPAKVGSHVWVMEEIVCVALKAVIPLIVSSKDLSRAVVSPPSSEMISPEPDGRQTEK